MPRTICAYENAVAASARSRFSDEALSNHIRSCVHCTELAYAAESMRGMTAEPEWPSLPDPDLLWIQAQLANTHRERTRAIVALGMLESGAVALLCTCAFILLPKLRAIGHIMSEILAWKIAIGDVGDFGESFFTGPALLASALLLVAFTFLIRPALLKD
jgi:hypothetical protein